MAEITNESERPTARAEPDYLCPCCLHQGPADLHLCSPGHCRRDRLAPRAWVVLEDGTPRFPIQPLGSDIYLEDVFEIIRQAEESNPHWFRAMLASAKVQAERRAKYSGDGDPYTNFIKMSQLLDVPMDQVFRFYCAIKMARLAVTDGDFSDEKVNDTLTDLANYALLWQGWRLREAADQGPRPG